MNKNEGDRNRVWLDGREKKISTKLDHLLHKQKYNQTVKLVAKRGKITCLSMKTKRKKQTIKNSKNIQQQTNSHQH